MSPLANAFSRRLAYACGPLQIIRIAQLNAEESNPLICHTHDFCDANQVMLDAWKEVKGRDLQLQDEYEMLEVGHAWKEARHAGFRCG